MITCDELEIQRDENVFFQKSNDNDVSNVCLSSSIFIFDSKSIAIQNDHFTDFVVVGLFYELLFKTEEYSNF